MPKFIWAPEEDKKNKLARVAQQNASVIQEQAAPPITPATWSSDWIGVPKPKVATAANPVVAINMEKKDPGYTPMDYTDLEGMDGNGLQDYIDRANVKVWQGNALSQEEQLRVLKAGRLLQQQQTSATAQNPYTSMIQEEQQQRDAVKQKLAGDTAIAVEKQGNVLQQQYGQKKQQLVEQWRQQKDAAQSVLSFSGFGRSTYAADQQVKIEQNVQQAMWVLDAEREAALEKFRLQQEGADADTIATYDNYIKELQKKSADFIWENVKLMNEYNLKTAATYEEKVQNILKLTQMMGDQSPLTPEEQKVADSYAALAIDKNGNINEWFMKMIPTNLVPSVLKKAAELKANTQPEWDYQYVPATEFQPAGYFNKADATFTPIDAGGASYWGGSVAPMSGGQGMRTDRNNNPTAMTTDVARSIGLKEWEDFVQGDPFTSWSGKTLYTAKLLWDPISTTIKWLDTAAQDPQKQAFYTGSWTQRRTHTALQDAQWLQLTPQQKAEVVLGMYQREWWSWALAGQGGGNDALWPLYERYNSSGLLPDAKDLRRLWVTMEDFVQGAKSFQGSEWNSALEKLPASKRATAVSLLKDFENEQIVKSFAKQQEAKTYIDTFDLNTTNPSDDQSLIYGFAKMMDPDSVVREGEYATVQKYAQNRLSTLWFNAQRVIDNAQVLTPKARKQMISTMTSRYTAGKRSYDNLVNQKAKQFEKVLWVKDGKSYFVDYVLTDNTANMTNTGDGKDKNVDITPKANSYLDQIL